MTATSTNLAMTAGTAVQRLVLKCAACSLTQFMTHSGMCRKCGKSLYVPRFRLNDAPTKKAELITNVRSHTAFDAIQALPERIKRLRKLRRMTQDDFSARSGYGRGTVSRFESGEFLPSFDGIMGIANALGISIRSILRVDPLSEITDDGWLVEIAWLIKGMNWQQMDAALALAAKLSARGERTT